MCGFFFFYKRYKLPALQHDNLQQYVSNFSVSGALLTPKRSFGEPHQQMRGDLGSSRVPEQTGKGVDGGHLWCACGGPEGGLKAAPSLPEAHFAKHWSKSSLKSA